MKEAELKKLLEDMSVEEKIGQLLQLVGNLYSDDAIVTGALDDLDLSEEEVNLSGSVLSISGAEKLMKIQKDCMAKQPHHIPQIFMQDIINGFQTIYPVPLAQGATFEPELVKELASMAAKEGAASGIHVTFSPMVDLVRDARWGRVMESTGEDPYLNALMGVAMVEGYQGADVKEKGNLAACVKHFAAYGAPEAGRDYDNVELSERTLREDYFPAYEAAIKAGAKLVMSSFNTLNRIPSSGNKWLMKKILREEMGFEGVLISDYAAVKEMINHGIARDEKQAAKLAIEAGLDIEMMSFCYIRGLKALLEEGKISMEMLDTAVYRVLRLKNDLGLFENPYKDASVEDEQKLLLCEEHRALARKAAVKSFVLLQNADGILPLQAAAAEKIVFMGPYADNKEVYGSWSFPEDISQMVTIKEGVEKLSGSERFSFVKGSEMFNEHLKLRINRVFERDDKREEELLAEALEAAKKADKVVLCLGEHLQQSGEATSRTQLTIPETQMNLLRKVSEVNDNIITLVFAGRPVELQEVSKLSKAVMMVWFPGNECGNAVKEVLFGEKEPEGRLSMSFPYRTAQEPMYYNRFRTGRPNDGTLDQIYVMGYIDQIDKALYPFGTGMGYTTFSYGEVKLSGTTVTGEQSITASVLLTNTGDKTGTETVQMYLSDLYGSVVRPRRQLKGFEKVTLAAGESREVRFEITEEMLRFYNIDMEFTSEEGACKVYIGHDCTTENQADFALDE